ncbi:MAG: xanthine dehydrogenase family protein subunit M [Deltaproteobacteria bacterium]|nr:xanthine dehydrogenase family protein subunit M [Deltaproteobacteria bacterium]
MAFSYFRPSSLDEALRSYSEAGQEAAYLAGGTDLLVRYKKGAVSPGLVISLNGLQDLDYVIEEDDRVLVGGLTRLRTLELSPVIARNFPVLNDALRAMASVQIRNVATMAGNVVNAAPSADTAPPLLALGAEVVLQGLGGERRLALKDFFLSPGRTALEPGQILTGFILPKPRRPAGGAYAKVSRRRAMDLALLGVAVQIELEDDAQTCRRARIGLGVAGPTPRRAFKAEEHLAGRVADEAVLTQAGKLAAEESQCRTSLRGEAWYRREMIRVHVRRMGLLALERAAS